MKPLVACILATIAVVICGQPSELICFNPTKLAVDPVAARSSIQELQPLLEQASALTVPQLEGLSIEEAAQAAPEILNNTGYTLFKQSEEDLQDFIDANETLPGPGDRVFATFQSLINTTDGMEIFDTMLQDPQNIVRLFFLLVQNFDLDCMDEPNTVFLTLLTTLMSNLLEEPFRDNFVDIFNASFVTIAIQTNRTENFISVLEPLSKNLDAAEDVEGALASLLSFATEDSITVALSSALENSGLVTNPEGIGAILTAFFARIQQSFEIDGQEFVTFMNDIFKSILAAIK
eukprot:TRINITY_DN159_c0_g2_i12.p1 TRINITY_DN159_c0_g2~~TRINITY_DN159_c0_g2_i12.p1  ORF type:complete len:291 (+),score=54.65 TRINITY_DN159_c0_g2_i12:146-1018(+)